jgi:hypothetical protein
MGQTVSSGGNPPARCRAASSCGDGAPPLQNPTFLNPQLAAPFLCQAVVIEYNIFECFIYLLAEPSYETNSFFHSQRMNLHKTCSLYFLRLFHYL